MKKPSYSKCWQNMTFSRLQSASLVWLSAGLILLLSSCSTVSSKPQDRVLPQPHPVNLLKVEFSVQDGRIHFKTIKDYENLSANMAEILRYISQSKDYMEVCR